MEKKSNNGLVGVVLVGVGAGLAAAGVALLTPVCISWSRKQMQNVFERGKEGVRSGFESVSDKLTDVANRAQHPLGEAAKAAKQGTAIAAGAIETAAHYVKERVQ
ncbi:MAG TPA: hypothetical protein VHY56_06835 [Candidatus Binataceae bacterium]|jgi:hypothetical protein|nr:hypothetical protein [Candidatus Binataceae bacterium]